MQEYTQTLVLSCKQNTKQLLRHSFFVVVVVVAKAQCLFRKFLSHIDLEQLPLLFKSHWSENAFGNYFRWKIAKLQRRQILISFNFKLWSVQNYPWNSFSWFDGKWSNFLSVKETPHVSQPPGVRKIQSKVFRTVPCTIRSSVTVFYLLF